MKQRIDKVLPYPLLAEYTDDYENSSFIQKIKTSIYGSNLMLNLDCELNDDGIQSLISEGKACVVYHIECSHTGYRKILKATASDFKIASQIPFKCLHGDVEINTFVIAEQKIEGYKNSHFNQDYEGLAFNIDAGCRIAEAKLYTVSIPLKLTDFVEDNNPYVVVIPKNDDSDQKPSINLDTPKIQVLVPKKASQNYAVLQGTAGMRDVLYSMFLVPAVFQGLLAIKGTKGNDENLEAMKSLLWVQSMEDELKGKFNKSLEDIQNSENEPLYELADSMLGNPLVSGTEYLMKAGNSEDSNEY